MILKSQITVIIRSAGERTAESCASLLKNFFPANQVQTIKEIPFSQAIRKSLETGLDSKRPWLLCVDADVLVSSEGIIKLLEAAGKAPNEVFEIQGLIFDKFFPVFRPSGGRVYRMAFAEKALEFIPKEGTTLRPEFTMLNAMAQAGQPWMQCDAVVGVHDFEQYYRDIFKKCFLQGHKHKAIIPMVLDYWVEQSITDPDFKVAILGLLYGLNHSGTVLIDKRFQEERTLQILKEQGFSEKEGKLTLPEGFVSHLLSSYQGDRFGELQKRMMPPELKNRVVSIPRPGNEKIGFQAKALYKSGNIFIRMGELLRAKAVRLSRKG